MTNQNGNSRSTFSGKMGYVLAVAGSAVGLGNIWRFPYLAAEYGGGIFLLTYLLLAVTFGYTMIVSETALGRGTRKSPVGAFHHFGKSGFFTAGGWINAVIPMLILPYYSVIGGWVTRYLFEYLAGDTKLLATDTFFGAFVSDGMAAEFWFIVFTAGVLAIILAGVKNGVERVSKIMMPVLIVLAVMVAGYSVTLPGAWAGVTYFMVPNLEHFSWMTVVSAMGQMFYSLSVAMGILYTYGSYMKKEFDLEHATFQVIAFDSGISVLASLMIIPAVFAFSGGDPSMLNAGPSLMFITIPKVFASMGLGTLVGVVFFTLVLFAALTSAISLAETSVSTFQDECGWSRNFSTFAVFILMIMLGSLSSLGFGPLASFTIFGMDILSFFDFLTNSIMMPVSAFATCVLIVVTVGIKWIENEVKQSSKFRYECVYGLFVRFLAPICLAVIFISSLANVLGFIHM